MNVLFKHRYFRRECMAHTWGEPKHLAKHYPNSAWCLDYVNHVEDFDIIWKLYVYGDFRNLKKVRKSTYCKTMDITIYTSYIGPTFYPVYDLEYKKSSNESIKIIDAGLIISSYYGLLEVVQYLVEKGANMNVNRCMPLRLSIRFHHIDVSRYLVKNGAKIYAIEQQYPEKMNLLS